METTEGRVTVEGIAKADNGLGAFEISSYIGSLNDNPDWTEKGPHAKGKTDIFLLRI